MKILHQFVWFLVLLDLVKGFLLSESTGQYSDICANAEVIPFEPIRTFVYELSQEDIPLCDKNIINETKWYKATEDMVTNATRENICSTTVPLWLQSNISVSTFAVGKEMESTICVPGLLTACDCSFPIKVINCGSFRVYKLKPPKSCAQAYCFGDGVKDNPPSQKVSKPTVEHIFTKERGFVSYQVNNFKCVFPFLTSPNPSEPFLYQIYWDVVHINAIDEVSCPLYIEMAVPAGSGVCESRLTGENSCGIIISANRWNETHVMNIVHQDTGNYQLTSSEAEMEIYLQTFDFRLSKLWSHILLPVVKVMNDTYDCNIIKYDTQNPGTFIMYRNIDEYQNIMEVQIEVTHCNHGTHIYCVCGIAVRAGGDVFVINRCPHVTRNVFAFRSCIDDILDVRKIDELNYKIYLPSGTYIQTRLWLYKNVNVMEVDIFPSRADIHKSEGLCSKLGSNKLIKRDGSAAPFSAQPDDFSLSWRVEDADNLLEMNDINVKQLTSMHTQYRVCTCGNGGNMPVNEALCSQQKNIICDVIQTVSYQKNTCYAKRNRRSG
ncbi:uncharacterized protein LOC144622187 [Crassostrea virginica]